MKTAKVYIETGADGYDIRMNGKENGLDYGLLGQGRTIEEAKADFLDAYMEMKEAYAEMGRPFAEVEFDYHYDMTSFLRQYAYIFSLAGLSRMTGINQGQLSHYINGVSKPTEKTINRIQNSILSFANELSSVRFA